MAHWHGRGVAKDDGEAVRWWRQAAEKGNAEAQCLLGNMWISRGYRSYRMAFINHLISGQVLIVHKRVTYQLV